MAELPRAAELHQDFISAVRVKLGGRVDLRNLARWSILGAGFSQLGVRTNKVAVDAFDGTILDRAHGTDLEAYCRARGPVVRFPAVKAKGSIAFTRPTAAAGAGTIYAGTEIRVPYEGKSYVFVATEDKSIGGAELTITVQGEAQAAGAASNVGTVSAALALTGLPAALFDATLTPSSITVAGGADEELDPQMRYRHRLWEQARQRATGAAILYAALSVNGVKHVVLADVRDPHLGGFCNLYVGDVNFASTSTMKQAVMVALESWRAQGSPITVRGMAQSDVTVSALVKMARPIAVYDASALRRLGSQAALDYFDRRIDPYAYDPAMLGARISRIHDEVAGVAVSLPASGVSSPISPSAFKATGSLPGTLTRYRTQASLVTINVEGPS